MEKAKKKKIILIGLGTAAAGVLGYFGWQFFKGRRDTEMETPSFNLPEPPSQSSFVPPVRLRNDEFPLKNGSKGPRVKLLQESLIEKHGKSILPKYGADGDFGSETVAALKTAGLPEVINEATFNLITQGGSSIDYNSLAQKLHSAALSKNLSLVISNLKSMRSTEDYVKVSEVFKTMRIGGVRKTLVNGLLDSFPSEPQKQQIRLEFSRMGLKYDGSKWSLSGLDGFSLITIKPTVIWESPKKAIKVPSGMVLGSEITERNGYTLFENGGRKFLVKTQTVKHL